MPARCALSFYNPIELASCVLQGLEIIAGFGDLVTFCCALALVLSPLASANYTIIVGDIMIANQVRHYWNTLLELLTEFSQLFIGVLLSAPLAVASAAHKASISSA